MAQEIADSTLLDTWGSGGLKIEPDISKIIEGWQSGEQPPHEYMNWLQNTFGSKLNHILKNGVASWNNKTPYLAGSSVQHNGNVWLCKTTNTNSAPTDANASWERIITVKSLSTLLNGYVKNPEELPASINLDTKTITGLYSQSTNAEASLALNYPIAFAGLLEVFAYSSMIHQRYWVYNSEDVYYRAKYSSGAWTPWTKGANVGDTVAAATKLETARTINGVAFNGTANITVSDSTAVKLSGNQTIAGVKTFSSSPIVPTPTTGTQVANKNYVDLKVALADFIGANQSLSQNGYQKLPGGLIIQWGYNAAGQTTTFPIAFPSLCASVVATYVDKYDTSAVGVGFPTKTSFNVPMGRGYRWIAVGY